jgi:hypothetical protein
MPKFATLQNDGKNVDSFRTVSGYVFSQDADTCKDIPAQYASEIVREYPFIKVIDEFESNDEELNKLIEDEDVDESMPKVMDPGEHPGLPNDGVSDMMHACPVCDSSFPSLRGMRLHRLKKHGQE